MLHPTSLPGGRLGAEAYAFVDWLAAAGQSWWQVLPLGPPDDVGSPYASSSAFAAWNGLPGRAGRARLDRASCDAFRQRERATGSQDWERAGGSVADQVRFDREWSALRAYARERGIRLIGDVPIYVAQDSVDHLTHPELFLNGARRRRAAGPARPAGPALGQPALRLGRAREARATAGGSSGCGGRSRCTTSRASTTSAASPPSGRFPRARRARRAHRPLAARPRRGALPGGRGRARRRCP